MKVWLIRDILGLSHGGLLFVVCGFWGLFCFGLPGSLDFCVWGVGLGLVWFSGLCANVLWGSGWLFVVGWGLLFVGFVWRV